MSNRQTDNALMMMTPNTKRPAAPTFYVIEIDDEGERRILEGFRTAFAAAYAAACIIEGIDVTDFAATWNASNTSGSARYMIGTDDTEA